MILFAKVTKQDAKMLARWWNAHTSYQTRAEPEYGGSRFWRVWRIGSTS